jgi:divalent metal cation (Fe/Co/Zn/Cd) transporter
VTLRERRRARWRAARPALLWTLGSFLVAVVIAVAATTSLVDSQQACFFGADPCPAPDDPRLAWIAVALVVIPLVWLLGLLLLAARAMVRGSAD